MKENTGHARCNAFGIRYVFQNKKFDNLILMDGDGEDRPVEIKSLLNNIKDEPHFSVVAKRVKRSEGPFFQFLYQVHKLITIIFTGKKINFGNYSILTKKDVETRFLRILQGSRSNTSDKNAYKPFVTDTKKPTRSSKYTKAFYTLYPKAKSLKQKSIATGLTGKVDFTVILAASLTNPGTTGKCLLVTTFHGDDR